MAPTSAELEPPPQLSLKGIHILNWCVFGVSTVALVIRIYARLKHFRKLFSDDFVVVWAWVFLLGYAIVCHLIAPYSLSYQATFSGIAPPDLYYESRDVHYYRLQYAQIIIFIVSLYSIKLSFMLFFWRLSSGARTVFTLIYWWTTTILILLTFIGAWVLESLYCHAENSVACTTPTRLNNAKIGTIYSYSADVGTDLLVIGMPIHIMWGVQLPWKRRLILSIILFAGILIVGVGLGRGAALEWGKNSALDRLIFWGDIELGTAFVVCSLAAYSSFFAGKTAAKSPTPFAHRKVKPGRNGPREESLDDEKSEDDLEAGKSRSAIAMQQDFGGSDSTLKEDDNHPEEPDSTYRGVLITQFDKTNQSSRNTTTVESAEEARQTTN